MSRRFAGALALAFGLAGPATSAQFEFDLSGLGIGILSNTALSGDFGYDVSAGAFTSIAIQTNTASYLGGTGSISVDTTEASAPITFFSFTHGRSTLVMDIENFNLTSTGIDAGESATFTASATQGSVSADNVFELTGLPSDMFGGTVTVTNRIPQVSDPIPSGPTAPIQQVSSNDPTPRPAGNNTVTPAAIPLPASLPLVLTGLGALIWLRRRTH